MENNAWLSELAGELDKFFSDAFFASNVWFGVIVGGLAIVLIVSLMMLIRVRRLGELLENRGGGTDKGAAPSAQAAVSAAPAGNDEELIAVMAAALQMCEEPGKSFAVRSVKKIETRGGNAWARAGRAEQMASRF